jgi:glycosyltransferase involved in cell wall biosynthesis
MFLEVARSVRMSRPDIKVKYAVIGGGELGAQLKELAASLGLSDEVYFLGWREDLGSIYRELDVVALTSLNEGTPLALIEAMAIGKAIIATDVGGVPDIIQDGKTGIIVHSGDIDMFAKNLINILDDKALRNKLGESAVQGAGKFSPDNLVKAATELYMECVRA